LKILSKSNETLGLVKSHNDIADVYIAKANKDVDNLIKLTIETINDEDNKTIGSRLNTIESPKEMEIINQKELIDAIYSLENIDNNLLLENESILEKRRKLETKLDELIKYYENWILISKKNITRSLDPSLSIANLYDNLADAYYLKGNYNKAAEYSTNSLSIKESKIKDSLSLAITLQKNANSYYKIGELDNALNSINNALNIRKNLGEKENILGIANCYYDIGKIYFAKNDFEQSIICFMDAIQLIEEEKILKGKNFYSSYLVNYYTDLANSYNKLGKQDIALENYHNALELSTKDSISAANLYIKIGNIICNQSSDEALKHYLDAFYIINKNYYIENKSPVILELASKICKIALENGYYKLALDYANRAVAIDENYKYAYYYKASALERIGRVNEGILVLDDVLKIDYSYGDAIIKRMEMIIDLVRNNKLILEKSSFIEKEISNIQNFKNIKRTNFDNNIKEELEIRSKISSTILDDNNINLPATRYDVGTKPYLEKLKNIQADLNNEFKLYKTPIAKNSSNNNDFKNFAKNENLDDDNIKILNGIDAGLLDFAHSFYVIEDAINNLNNSIKKEQEKPNVNQPYINELMATKNREQLMKDKLILLSQNKDVADFYAAFLTEISAFYVSALALKSGKIAQEKSNKIQTAGDYLLKGAEFASDLIGIVPIIGNIASKAIGLVTEAIDSYKNISNRLELQKLLNLAKNISEFDKIAEPLALIVTEHYQNQIKSFQGQNIKESYLEVAMNGLETVIEKYLNKEQSKAGLFGKTMAHQAIRYMQTDEAKNFSYIKDDNRGTVDFKPREFIIADLIANELKKTIIKDNIINQGPDLKPNHQLDNPSLDNNIANKKKQTSCCNIF
jgi:tetratricopeptide (TPR) repeat protein